MGRQEGSIGPRQWVAVYGLVLMPMGSVILIDFYLMRRIGLQSGYAEKRGILFNWAAGLTWFVTLGTCLGLVYSGIEINGFRPF